MTNLGQESMQSPGYGCFSKAREFKHTVAINNGKDYKCCLYFLLFADEEGLLAGGEFCINCSESVKAAVQVQIQNTEGSQALFDSVGEISRVSLAELCERAGVGHV